MLSVSLAYGPLNIRIRESEQTGDEIMRRPLAQDMLL